MTKHKKNTELIIIAASAFFIIAFAVFGLGKVSKKDPLTLSVVSDENIYEVGDTINAKVYLSGKDADKATVAEIKLDYDKKVFRLLDADAGELYENPLLLDWDIKSGTFAMAINPGVDTTKEMTGSLVDLTFKVLAVSEGSDISVKDSQIYIYKKGVESPLTPVLTFTTNGKEK